MSNPDFGPDAAGLRSVKVNVYATYRFRSGRARWTRRFRGPRRPTERTPPPTTKSSCRRIGWCTSTRRTRPDGIYTSGRTGPRYNSDNNNNNIVSTLHINGRPRREGEGKKTKKKKPTRNKKNNRQCKYGIETRTWYRGFRLLLR